MRDDKILDSWKEITNYLKRSRKTCIRWEKEHGLPIHRLDESPKSRVYAYRDELDKWMDKKLKKKLLPKSNTIKKPRKVNIIIFAIIASIILTVLVILIW